MSKPTYRWKFLDLSEDGQIISAHDKSPWVIGQWRTTTKQPKNCKSGFHCSRTLSQALSYVQGAVVAKVEVAGKADIADDKESWQKMRIVQAWEWDKIASVKLAIYAAEQVIDIFEAKYPDDSRPRDAIKAAKRYLRNPSPDAADAARAAADAADAARAAADAGYATRAAADAGYAARAARAAADAARAAADAGYATRAAADAGYAARAAADAADAARAAADAGYATRAAADAGYAARAAADAADAARATMIVRIGNYMRRQVKTLKEIQ